MAVVKRKVLLIEDDLFLGDMLADSLSRYNNADVSWFVRARADAASLVLMAVDGKETVYSAERLKADFDIAFVDYRLKMSPLTGTQVTRMVANSGQRVVASSGLGALNQELLDAGARWAMEKDKIMLAAIRQPDFVESLCTALV